MNPEKSKWYVKIKTHNRTFSTVVEAYGLYDVLNDRKVFPYLDQAIEMKVERVG